jgi:hypothetical protein
VAATLAAQGVRATINGRVTDPTGAVVPGAKVTATNTGTNESRTVQSDASGVYVLPQLLPGEWMIAVEQTGFKKNVRRNITLETGAEVRIDITLDVGNVTETVDVTAEAPLIQSENTAVGNVVDQKKIVELPLNGRDYLQLAQLQPNVFAPAQNSTLGFRGGFNVAGNSEIANNYIKDGIDNNDETTNQPLQRPILDAVREFKVLTGTYGAEFGRQAGGQVIVTTKSGTNDWHGSAFEFHRNSPLDAKNFFAPRKPSFRRNQFGAVIGGPIRRDKTFIFGGYEGQRRGQQEAGLASVPSLAFKRGDFSAISANLIDPVSRQPFPNKQIPQARWSRQGAGLLALYPDPNLNVTSGNNFASGGTGDFSIDQFSVRADHRFSEKDNVFGVYEFADSKEFFPIANPLCSARDVPGWGCDELQRTQHSALVWTHVFTPSLINEARVGYTRFGFYRLQEDRGVDVVSRLGIGGLTDAGKTPFNNGAPQTTVTGFVTIGGPTNLPQGRHDNTYHYVENMTWVKGNHTMKWGLDIRRFLFNSFFTSFGRGSFAFDGRFSGNSVADLLLGVPHTADRNLGEPFHNMVTNTQGYFFQDDWKITPRLTLNLGLRYDLFLVPTERVNKIASFDPRTNTLRVAGDREAFINSAGVLEIRPKAGVGRHLWKTDKNNLAPRVGLAWRPFGDARTVIRAGFGTFYNHQIVGNGITPLSRNSPFRLRQTSGPILGTAAPSTFLDLANPFRGNPSVVPPGIQEDFRTAYVNQWSFGVQRELGRNFVLDVSYLGSTSHKLPMPWNINQAPPGAGSIASRRPYQGYGSITGGFVSSIGNAAFNAMQVRAERRFSRGLSFVSSYTWAKSIDQNSGISTGSDSSGNAQNARNLRAERARSDFDVAHRWVLSTVWDLPSFGSHPFVRAVFGGWQITGILTLQGGRPFTVTSGTDVSQDGDNTDRPIPIGDWRVASRGPDRWFNACTRRADGSLFNCRSGESPAWQIPAAGQYGTAGRNILRGDTLKNFDFGVNRSFRITERQSLQFRTEFFNLTNHPNFFFPTASLASSAGGQISRAAFQSQTGAQRQIQFGLKYIF